jgi:serine/threonine-protein kinase PpkA
MIMKIVCRLLIVLLSLAGSAGVQAQNRTPLPVPEAPELYQRVLTLPGARLSREPGSSEAGALPTFSILYVYGRTKAGNEDWLEVGSKIRGQPDGWLPKKVSEDWHTMLVVQYAPHGQRSRVPFFDSQAALEELLSASDSSRRGQAIIAGLEHNHLDPAIIAAEPENAVDQKSRFYVMPVLSAKPTQLADGSYVRLVQVASANAQSSLDEHKKQDDNLHDGGNKEFRIGLVFLLDTTKSMGPYIDATAELARGIVDRLVSNGNGDRLSIGVVAYRSNMAKEPRLEYVTRVFAPLDPKAPLEDSVRALSGITEAHYSTPAWDEDAFAGLHVALNDLNWDPFVARFLIMVTDSGPLPGNSPLVKFRNFDIENAVELANSRHIAVFPFHLLTHEGDTHGRAYAVGKWRRLGQTGDPSGSKYFAIPAGSPAVLSHYLAVYADQLAGRIAGASAGRPIEQVTVPPEENGGEAETEKRIAAALVNELFRAQAEYLGAKRGVTAPQFFRAWASDHDLAKPRIRALNVQVFLTRTQLSGLAQSLELIVEQAKRAQLAPQDFFQNLQVLAAQTASDPNRPMRPGPVESIEASNLLPAYLKLLPYHSKVMDMTRSQWLSGGVTGQQEFIDELDYKIQQYRDIDGDLNRWKRLDAPDQAAPARADAGDAVSPVPLDVLP